MGKFLPLSQYNFELHTDSVEFSPCGRQVLVGSYELDESTQDRNGQVAKFEVNGDCSEKSSDHIIPGILDLCWRNEEFCLAATSSGDVYSIRSIFGQPLTTDSVIKVSSKLLLSLDSDDSSIVATDEGGSAHLIDFTTSEVLSSWKAHEFAPWCVKFNRNDANMVLSGGDDSLARVWDRRVGFRACIFSRRHEMGVCSLSGVPNHPNLISTGCFDEKLRVWDLRSGRGGDETVVCHTEGGGVWRHKWSPDAHHVLLACMHAGFAVLRVPGNPLMTPIWPPSFYRPNAKLAYGVDWLIDANSSAGQDFRALIGACSFYDNHVSFATYSDVGQ